MLANHFTEGECGKGENMRPWFLLFLALLPIVSLQNAFAQSLQVQPIYGFSWPTHNIPVNVEASTPNATGAFSKAIGTWNLAQQWFMNTYMAGVGEPFVFYETNSTLDSIVTVTFNQTQTTEDLGNTKWNAFHDQQGFFKKVVVSISIDLNGQDGQILSDMELQTLATHELGHALGLDHTTFSTSDLMNHVPKIMFPSTLNLYAAYLLSQSSNENNLPQQSVTLPGNIPYLTVSQAELETVTPPIVQTTTTSSLQLTQIANTLTHGPWPYIGILAVLAGVVVALAIRGRKKTISKADLGEAEVIFRENPIIENQPIRMEPGRKKCAHCGAEVPREELICRNCGMPAMYRK